MGEINVPGGIQLITYDMLLGSALSISALLREWNRSNNIYVLSRSAYQVQQTVELAIRIQLQQATKENISRWSQRSHFDIASFYSKIKTHSLPDLYNAVNYCGCKFVDSEYFNLRKGIITDWESRGRYSKSFSVQDTEIINAISEFDNWIPLIKKVFGFQSISEREDFYDAYLKHCRTLSESATESFINNSVLVVYNARKTNNNIVIPSTKPFKRKESNLHLPIKEDDSNG